MDIQAFNSQLGFLPQTVPRSPPPHVVPRSSTPRPGSQGRPPVPALPGTRLTLPECLMLPSVCLGGLSVTAGLELVPP